MSPLAWTLSSCLTWHCALAEQRDTSHGNPVPPFPAPCPVGSVLQHAAHADTKNTDLPSSTVALFPSPLNSLTLSHPVESPTSHLCLLSLAIMSQQQKRPQSDEPSGVQKMKFPKPKNKPFVSTAARGAGMPPAVVSASSLQSGSSPSKEPARPPSQMPPISKRGKADAGREKAPPPAQPAPVKLNTQGKESAQDWVSEADVPQYKRSAPAQDFVMPNVSDKALQKLLPLVKDLIPCSLPASSPFELRIFALRHSRTNDALQHAEAILRDINKLDGKVLEPKDPEFIDPKSFEVLEGEPFLKGNAATLQSTARIIYSDTIKQAGRGYEVELLDRLRKRLVKKRFECFWSCGRDLDRRGLGEFYFEKEESHPEDDLKEISASAWIRRTLVDHPYVSDYGQFKFSRERGLRHVRHVKFLHPASVARVAEWAKDGVWTDSGYTIVYEPATTVITPTNPCTIAAHGAGRLSSTEIEKELWVWIRAFNDEFGVSEGLLNDGRRVHGKWYIVTPTSFALSLYICLQMPNVLAPWQMLYDLNIAECRVSTEVQQDVVRQKVEHDKQVAKSTREANEKLSALEARLERKEEDQQALVVWLMSYTAHGDAHRIASQQWTRNETALNRRLASAEAELGRLQARSDTLEERLLSSQKEVALWSTLPATAVSAGAGVGSTMVDILKSGIDTIKAKIAQNERDIAAKKSEIALLNDHQEPMPELVQTPLPRRLIRDTADPTRFEDVDDEDITPGDDEEPADDEDDYRGVTEGEEFVTEMPEGSGFAPLEETPAEESSQEQKSATAGPSRYDDEELVDVDDIHQAGSSRHIEGDFEMKDSTGAS